MAKISKMHARLNSKKANAHFEVVNSVEDLFSGIDNALKEELAVFDRCAKQSNVDLTNAVDPLISRVVKLDHFGRTFKISLLPAIEKAVGNPISKCDAVGQIIDMKTNKSVIVCLNVDKGEMVARGKTFNPSLAVRAAISWMYQSDSIIVNDLLKTLFGGDRAFFVFTD